jgi:hypothetical protein
LVKLVLLQRIVFVVVAFGAGKGQSEPGRRHGIDAVDDLLGASQFLVDPGLGVEEGVAMEARRDATAFAALRQQVAGDLGDAELIVGKVAVDRVDDPIPIPPGPVPLGVTEVSVAVGITGEVEPVARPAFGEVGRGEELASTIWDQSSGVIGDRNTRSGWTERSEVKSVFDVFSLPFTDDGSPITAPGGSPVRSSERRRNKVASSAGGSGWTPALASRASMKKSTGCFPSGTCGADGWLEGPMIRSFPGSEEGKQKHGPTQWGEDASRDRDPTTSRTMTSPHACAEEGSLQLHGDLVLRLDRHGLEF